MFMRNGSLIAATLVSAAVFSTTASGAMIATYSFTGVAGNAASGPVDAGSVAEGLTAGNALRGAGIGTTNSTSLPNSFRADDYNQSTAANAITANDFVSITLSPELGYTLDLDSLSFKMARTSSGPTQAFLRYSLDGFASDLWVTTSLPTSFPGTPVTVNFPNNVLHDSITSPVTFRWYAYSAAATSHITGLDDVVFSGTTVLIPEPASLALLGLGGLLMIPRRRRD